MIEASTPGRGGLRLAALAVTIACLACPAQAMAGLDGRAQAPRSEPPEPPPSAAPPEAEAARAQEAGTADDGGLDDFVMDGTDALEADPPQGIAASESPAPDQTASPLKSTLMQELAVGIHSPYEVVNNRSSLRVEYEKHVLSDFYFRLDSKLIAHWANDHQAEARDRDLHLASVTREAFVQFSRGSVSVKAGKQILIWGESDAGAITDVISPRNFSELFFIPLEEARIGQFMVTVDRFAPSGDWSLFYVPDAQYNEYPETGTAYFIDPFPGTDVRGGDVDRSEYGLRWKRTFGRSDIALMAAHLVDNDIGYAFGGIDAGGRPWLQRVKQRYAMLGGTFNFASGDWIVSGELAWKRPRAFNTASLSLIERDQVDMSLRAEYALGKGGQHTVSLEATNGHVVGWDEDIVGVPRNAASLVFGWNNVFANETFTVNLLSVMSRPYASLQHSLFTSYKWSDRLSINLDLFYLDVDDDRNPLSIYRGRNNAVLRLLYQF